MIQETNEYFAAGKNLTLLNDKKPIAFEWQKKKFSEDKVKAWHGNIGWVLDTQDLVIDVDPRNGGDVSFDKLIHTIPELSPTVNTPSGGWHVYLRLSADAGKIPARVKEFKGIDFLTKGKMCVIAGSSIDSVMYTWAGSGFEQNDASEALLDLIKPKSVADVEQDGYGKTEFPPDLVQQMLDKLNPDIDYHDWVKVGMALHDWDNDNGFLFWDSWSQKGESYTPGETESKWKSFSSGEVTRNSLPWLVAQYQESTAETDADDIITKLSQAKDIRGFEKLCHGLKKLPLTKAQRSMYVSRIKTTAKSLFNASFSEAIIRDMIQPVKEQQVPQWTRDWWYVLELDRYYNTARNVHVAASGFNQEVGKFVPVGAQGGKPSAQKFVADNGLLESARGFQYAPTVPERVFETDGKKYLNIFDFDSVPRAAESFTKEGKETIRRIADHAEWLLGDKEWARLLIHWCAHQVQYPGTKILWCPLIQSIQGTGKSFFGELLRGVLGTANVGVVNSAQVTSNFNSWAFGVCVNVLEEVRIRGKNRHEVLNSLKPLITDNWIQINEKNVPQFKVINTVNYICFTNYRDAVPMTIDDRRWWIIFSPVQSVHETNDRFGMSPESYFKDLFTGLHTHINEVRRYLLNLDIPESFYELTTAPKTTFKDAMIVAEHHQTEGLLETSQILQNSKGAWDGVVLSSSLLFTAVELEFPELMMNSKQKSFILKALGYAPANTRVTVNKAKYQVWYDPSRIHAGAATKRLRGLISSFSIV